MNPTLNIDKPKIIDVEKVKCNCCIKQVINNLFKKTTGFIRALTPF